MNKVDLSVNGVWLSEAVPGLVVTNIGNRELHPRSIRSETIKGIDGSVYMGSEYPDREIVVGFFINAKTNEERGSRYNDLASLLNCEQAKVIFSDELDKYFVATPTKSDAKTIAFYCSDPFKYSTTERTIDLANGKFTFTNNGSAPCPIRFELKPTKDLGYISIASIDGAMEYGDPEEKDTESTSSTQKVLSWEQFLQAADGGVHSQHPSSSPDKSYVFNRQTTIKECGPDKPWADGTYTSKTWLDLGGGTDGGNWISGALKTATIKADANGQVGASSFECSWRSWFQCFNWGEAGEQSVSFLTADDDVICRVGIYKDQSENYNCELAMKDAQSVRIFRWPVQQDSPFIDGNKGVVSVSKVDDRVNFQIGGRNYTYSDPAIKSLVCTKIQVEIARNMTTDLYMARNYVTDLSFNKKGVTGSHDVANAFSSGNYIIIDGSKGQISVDGTVRNDLEVLGTSYFKSTPGENVISVGFSSWYSGSKDMKLYIREAWL